VTVEPRVRRYATRSGIRIYQLPVETFPLHVNNIYLILDGDHSTLFDVGSGTPQSIEDLTRGFAEVRERFGERVDLAAVQHVVISHSHIDHFGFVAYFTRETDADVFIHELDARVLNNFEERIVLASKDLRVFMERSGLKPEARQELEEMYRFSKHFFKSVELDRVLRDGDRIINGYVVHHVPGHCPGQICLQVEDVSSRPTTSSPGSPRTSPRPRSRRSAGSSITSGPSRRSAASRESRWPSRATKRPSPTWAPASTRSPPTIRAA